MYRKILLAYDGSREGRAALREGAVLAHKCNAEIFLLSVLTGSDGIAIADGVHSGVAQQSQSDYFEGVLQEGASRLLALGMSPATRLVRGEPAQEISKVAKEIGADLVVVGHRRQSILSRWWSGSTGAYISDSIECSLLVSRNAISEDEFAMHFAPIKVEPNKHLVG